MPSVAGQVTVGGVAHVYCVHNRAKRAVTDIEFRASQTKPHLCSCCENLFLERTDTPMFCPTCRGANVHPLGGPLPAPKGVI